MISLLGGEALGHLGPAPHLPLPAPSFPLSRGWSGPGCSAFGWQNSVLPVPLRSPKEGLNILQCANLVAGTFPVFATICPGHSWKGEGVVCDLAARAGNKNPPPPTAQAQSDQLSQTKNLGQQRSSQQPSPSVCPLPVSQKIWYQWSC